MLYFTMRLLQMIDKKQTLKTQIVSCCIISFVVMSYHFVSCYVYTHYLNLVLVLKLLSQLPLVLKLTLILAASILLNDNNKIFKNLSVSMIL